MQFQFLGGNIMIVPKPKYFSWEIYNQNYVWNQNMVTNTKTVYDRLYLTNIIFSQLKIPKKYTLFKATEDSSMTDSQKSSSFAWTLK